MSKFKVGDVALYKGKEVKVLALNVWGNGQGVKIDNGEPNGMGISTEYEDTLELKTPSTPVGVKIEEGKFYKTRDGRKVGPMEENPDFNIEVGMRGETYPYYERKSGNSYTEDGITAYDVTVIMNEDIISEWQEGPIREVRRREIVPGQWGIVTVDNRNTKTITLKIEWGSFNSEELREASHLLAQIAEVLEEQG